MTLPCWQHQKKEAHLALLRERPAPPQQRPTVSRVAHRVATEFIEKYEWLGHMGSAKYSFGLWLGDFLAAVVCYSSPSAPGAFRRLLGEEQQGCVLLLSRGASAPHAPPWSASKLISAAHRLLSKEQSIRAILAYADPRAGEIGAVYQAANALYLGLTDSRGPGSYKIHGRLYHARAVPKHFGSAKHSTLAAIDPAYERYQRTRKHRYLFILSRGSARRRLLKQISDAVRPYPKRLLAPPTAPLTLSSL